MEQVRLGSSGLHVSRLALGMMSFGDTSKRDWVLGEEAAEPIVRCAVEVGITFFDTADMYAAGASEVVTGRLETMEALHDVVRAGKARYIGASTMAAWQFAHAQSTAERHGWTRFV